MKKIIPLTAAILFVTACNDSGSETASGNGQDSIWGYSSTGRNLVEIQTSNGQTIKAVDIDGIAHVGDMMLGRTEDLLQHGLTVAENQDQPTAQEKSISRAATIYPSSGFKWPDGIVPFALNSNLSSAARADALSAISYWNTNTNVKFIERTNEADYLLITNGNGCSSYVGKIGGAQAVTLAYNCGMAAAIHELGHAVGFEHEQTRSDRDNYVSIYWDNIQSGMEYNFEKINTSNRHDVGNYDYYSIMHYHAWAFSKNDQPTILPKQDDVDLYTMGMVSEMSAGDLAAVAAIYGDPGNGNDNSGDNDNDNSGDPDQNQGEQYSGQLSGSRATNIQPNGNWFQYQGGTLSATLSGPDNADFDLYLQQWNGRSWVNVAISESYSSSEAISYEAAAGYYQFVVLSYNGSGSYTFTLKR
ncbi:M12 family metallopeptidase [Gynuella sunshinyii]|uniref:Peptidase M12A domain-containing protein n=1 Tax=Gynuella sunshinyii YC6258 TaxID=1445510 RepID=A0A0C5VCM9_9GAMM|nr:M12 family metallopeptidase [Gynuella sunshinyii]AJQ97090.1 hypothetical Protein YC6258_05060 [Gynuella sunshinyii YC6258]